MSSLSTISNIETCFEILVINGQISRMQNNINSLTQLVSQLTSKLNTVESELAAQNLKNTGKETCITWV
jgi:archaellum component FlaC